MMKSAVKNNDIPHCNSCGITSDKILNSDDKKKNLLRCSGCKKVQYCGKECQLKDWKVHKVECKKVTNSNSVNQGSSKISDATRDEQKVVKRQLEDSSAEEVEFDAVEEQEVGNQECIELYPDRGVNYCQQSENAKVRIGLCGIHEKTDVSYYVHALNNMAGKHNIHKLMDEESDIEDFSPFGVNWKRISEFPKPLANGMILQLDAKYKPVFSPFGVGLRIKGKVWLGVLCKKRSLSSPINTTVITSTEAQATTQLNSSENLLIVDCDKNFSGYVVPENFELLLSKLVAIDLCMEKSKRFMNYSKNSTGRLDKETSCENDKKVREKFFKDTLLDLRKRKQIEETHYSTTTEDFGRDEDALIVIDEKGSIDKNFTIQGPFSYGQLNFGANFGIHYNGCVFEKKPIDHDEKSTHIQSTISKEIFDNNNNNNNNNAQSYRYVEICIDKLINDKNSNNDQSK